jgi:hypothetical protein
MNAHRFITFARLVSILYEYLQRCFDSGKASVEESGVCGCVPPIVN